MPMMPSRLPPMRWPSIHVGDQPGHLRSPVRTDAPSASRRGTARINAMVMSAVSSVNTPGVLVTVMPRSTALATSMLSTPVPNCATSLNRSEEHTSELQSLAYLVCRLLLEKKNVAAHGDAVDPDPLDFRRIHRRAPSVALAIH